MLNYIKIINFPPMDPKSLPPIFAVAHLRHQGIGIDAPVCMTFSINSLRQQQIYSSSEEEVNLYRI